MDVVCTTYVDNMTGEKWSSIQVAIAPLVYWSVRLSSKSGGDGVKGVETGGKGIVVLARHKFSLY